MAKVATPMSPALAKRVVAALDEGLPHVRTICLHLYGGEPLTNLPAMEAMLDYTRDKDPERFSLSITTNGSILSQPIIDLLKAGKFEVVLSIDGPPEIHDQCRRTRTGQPTHERVMAFLNALRAETECRVRGSSVVRSGWSLAQATEYLRSLPIDLIKAQAVRGATGSAWALSDAEKDAYLDDLEAIGMQVVADLEAGRMPKDDRFTSWVLQLLKGTSREFYCGAGKTVFGVTPSGDILPCVLLDAGTHRLGHVEDIPATFVEAGRRWRNSHPHRTECRDCGELFLCGGGCPAMLSVCGAEECVSTRKECQVARSIFAHFDGNDGALFTLAGITWE